MGEERVGILLAGIAEARAQLDAAEPDLPGWEAEARLRRLEAELVEMYGHRIDELRAAAERRSGQSRPTSGAVEARSEDASRN